MSLQPKKVIRALELNPSFVQDCSKQGWQLTSLGQYLTSLRINAFNRTGEPMDFPRLLEREVEVTIGATLLRSLGPRLGRVLLPMIGISQFDTWLGKLSASVASYLASHFMAEVSESWDPTQDRAAFPFAVAEVVSFININQKLRSQPPTGPTSLDWMQRGEIGCNPSYASISEEGDESNPDTDRDLLIPNPFIVEKHFHAALSGLEDKIRTQSHVTATSTPPNAEIAHTTEKYFPDDRSLPPPTPINQRLLPDLHLGYVRYIFVVLNEVFGRLTFVFFYLSWGSAKCTHTKREILRNRLFAVLFTKLSYNYLAVEQHGETANLFKVCYNGHESTFPDEFVQALERNGHTIQVCPRSTITTFGIAACVKEDDGSWTNIPIAFFFRTGFEDRNGKPAYFAAPHGGLDMKIRGPLVGEGNNCDIQFYVAIEGLCGWHSNHNADVPWIRAVATTDVYSGDMALRAVRMAGLLGVTFNALATEVRKSTSLLVLIWPTSLPNIKHSQMNLPFGGYGILGVCNDTAAFIDWALRKETNIYPLVSTGRFLFHCARRLLQLKEGISKHSRLSSAVSDADRLVAASCNMDSDIHNSPGHLVGATRRYLASNPVSCFQLTEDSKTMLSAVAARYEQYVDCTQVMGSVNESQLIPNFVNYLLDQHS